MGETVWGSQKDIFIVEVGGGVQGVSGFSGYSGPAGNYLAQSFTSQTSVVVTHNLGRYPEVQIVDTTGEIIYTTVTHSSLNAFTVDFGGDTVSGTILVNLGIGYSGYSGYSGTGFVALTTKTSNYTLTENDEVVLCSGTFTITLPTAVGKTGKKYYVKNIGTGSITIDPNGTETIDSNSTIIIRTRNAALAIVSDNANWRII